MCRFTSILLPFAPKLQNNPQKHQVKGKNAGVNQIVSLILRKNRSNQYMSANAEPRQYKTCHKGMATLTRRMDRVLKEKCLISSLYMSIYTNAQADQLLHVILTNASRLDFLLLNYFTKRRHSEWDQLFPFKQDVQFSVPTREVPSFELHDPPKRV